MLLQKIKFKNIVPLFVADIGPYIEILVVWPCNIQNQEPSVAIVSLK